MVVETNKKAKKKDNSVEIEAYLKPSWGLASTNTIQRDPYCIELFNFGNSKNLLYCIEQI